ncbi:MAG: hypothetical protein RRA35_13365, partial [Desulfomonilia bacterium]|nr:hypothetical protein [Desulfomonilia bacterium]
NPPSDPPYALEMYESLCSIQIERARIHQYNTKHLAFTMISVHCGAMNEASPMHTISLPDKQN